MSDFLVALGLVFVIEGLIFAASPGAAKNAMAHVMETADGPLRVVGIASAVVGVILVWLVRGVGPGTRQASRSGRRRKAPFPPDSGCQVRP